MIKKFLFLIIFPMFLTGCFAESFTLIQSGVGAQQGRALHSLASPVVSLGVKQSTGKFPLEHVYKREKERLAKKTTDFESKIIHKTKKTINKSKEKIIPFKNSMNNRVTKLNYNLLKLKTFALENFKHKPRFSYKVR